MRINPAESHYASQKIAMLPNKKEAPLSKPFYEFTPNVQTQLKYHDLSMKSSPANPSQVISRIRCMKQNDQFSIYFEHRDSEIETRFTLSNQGKFIQIVSINDEGILETLTHSPEIYLPLNEVDQMLERMKEKGFRPTPELLEEFKSGFEFHEP